MNNNNFFFGRFRIAVCLLIVVLVMVFILPASAETKPEYKWRFGVPWSRELQNESMQLFCDLVKLYSDGRMEIILYPNGALGSHDEIFHAVQEGSIEMGVFASYVNLVPGGMINWMPWTIESYNESAIAFTPPDGILYKVMSEAYKEVGMNFLFIILQGPYGLGNNIRPIKTPDDLKNILFRVSSSLGFVKTLENMGKGTGMTLATIPWADLYNALERKVVDGCWDMWPSLVEERHFEVLKYYTALGMGWDANNVCVNKDKWDELPSDLQEVLFKAGRIAELHEYEVHRRADAEFMKIVAEGGVEIYHPTAEEREQFRVKANMPAIWEELCKPWFEEHYPGQNMTQKVLEELSRIHNIYTK